MRHRHNGILSAGTVTFLALWVVMCSPARADVQTPLPADLTLTGEDEDAVESLSSFAWGTYFLLRGQGAAPEAEPHFLRALSLNPGSKTILDHLVGPLYLAQKHERIVELLTPLAEQHPEAVHLQFALSQALNDTEKPDEAGQTLYRALDGTGWTEATLVRELFVHHWRAKQYKEAERLLSRARRRRSLREKFYVEHAYATYYNARATLSDPELSDRARESYARNALKHAKLAVVLVEQASRVAEVAGLASMLLSLEQWEDVAELSRRARDTEHLAVPELDMVWVEALRAMGKDTEAGQVLAELTQKQLPRRLLAEMARLFIDADELDRGARYLELALRAFPTSVGNLIQLAYVYLRQERPRKTISLLSRLRDLPPGAARVMAHAYREIGERERALEILRAAETKARQQKNPDFLSVDFYLSMATLCEEVGKIEEGVEMSRKAIDLAPSDATCANFLGYVLADHNRNLPEAEALIRQALRLEPLNYAFLDSLAWVHFRQGRYREALVEISRATSESGGTADPVVLDHAGDICALNGLRRVARIYWQEAMDTAGLDEKARVRIQKKLDGGPVLPDGEQ